jgi:hypothetical protein
LKIQKSSKKNPSSPSHSPKSGNTSFDDKLWNNITIPSNDSKPKKKEKYLLNIIKTAIKINNLHVCQLKKIGKDQKNPGQNFPDHFRIVPNVCGLKLHTLS